MIDKVVLLNERYDIYKNLLKEDDRKYFELYYLDNLSLSEISDNEGITRSAISKKVNRIEDKLLSYEEKLKLNEKNKKILEIISGLDKKVITEIEELL